MVDIVKWAEYLHSDLFKAAIARFIFSGQIPKT